MAKGSKKKSSAKATLVKLEELLDIGVSVCFDAVRVRYQITCYPGSKRNMEHHHFEGESIDDCLTQAHHTYYP